MSPSPFFQPLGELSFEVHEDGIERQSQHIEDQDFDAAPAVAGQLRWGNLLQAQLRSSAEPGDAGENCTVEWASAEDFETGTMVQFVLSRATSREPTGQWRRGGRQGNRASVGCRAHLERRGGRHVSSRQTDGLRGRSFKRTLISELREELRKQILRQDAPRRLAHGRPTRAGAAICGLVLPPSPLAPCAAACPTRASGPSWEERSCFQARVATSPHFHTAMLPTRAERTARNGQRNRSCKGLSSSAKRPAGRIARV